MEGNKLKKVLFVFGTRPEAIKMAPVVAAFHDHRAFLSKVCVTAQHREMLDQVLEFFSIVPDYDLDLMKKNQTLYTVTASVISSMEEVLKDFGPDFVLVHGDTTTSMSAAIASTYAGARLCHVEAGLRTYNKKAPFPEEINRQITARLADIHFAPTERGCQNLLNEGVQRDHILITGNTVIDALKFTVSKVKAMVDVEIDGLLSTINFTKKVILITGHRRENFGKGFQNICRALRTIAEKSDVEIVYPVHLNPNVRKPVFEALGDIGNVKLIEPLSYAYFVWLMDRSYIIITDSGGVQEEAPSLGKPVLVMREITERPEAIEAGTVKLVGTDPEVIAEEALKLINDSVHYSTMSNSHNPYGDGNAAGRILQHLIDYDK